MQTLKTVISNALALAWYMHHDMLKKKYFLHMNEFILKAEHGLYINWRPTLLKSLMNAVGLAYNLPDLPILKHWYIILAIYWEFQEDYSNYFSFHLYIENVMYWLTRLKDIAEADKDYSTFKRLYFSFDHKNFWKARFDLS